MVDIARKAITRRRAVASGRVYLGTASFEALTTGRAAKGDVLTIAKIAGITAAKRTGEFIPLCHPLPLDHVGVSIRPDPPSMSLRISAEASCTGRTGVEMEALTAVTLAALTVYDMLKAVDRDIRISDIQLEEKSGGRSGHWKRAKQ